MCSIYVLSISAQDACFLENAFYNHFPELLTKAKSEVILEPNKGLSTATPFASLCQGTC